MANKDISKKLKQARLNRGLSQKDVYTGFQVKQSRFSAWENGLAEPDIKTFLKLCHTYGIKDIYGYFCKSDAPHTTAYNIELTRAVQKLNELSRDKSDTSAFDAVLNCLDFEYSRHSKRRMLDLNYKLRDIPVYMQPAAAGLGNYITDDDREIMSLPAPPEADAGIRISGDSMEPDIRDGDIVYIKYMPHIDFGEIGIFIFRGEAYCKKLDKVDGRPCLISLNTKYSPITLRENESLTTVGKIIF